MDIILITVVAVALLVAAANMYTRKIEEPTKGRGTGTGTGGGGEIETPLLPVDHTPKFNTLDVVEE